MLLIRLSLQLIYNEVLTTRAKREIKMIKKGIILVTILILQITPLVYASNSTTAIYFININDDNNNYFIYDTIYVSGENFEPDTNYTISLVKDLTLTNNMLVPESIPGTTTMITSDSDGNITLTEIWSQFDNTESPYLPAGEYYIIVDIDNDGIYNEEIDVTGSMTIRHGAGITSSGESEVPQFHIPEFPGGSIMAILAFLIAALLIRSKKITLLPKIS